MAEFLVKMADERGRTLEQTATAGSEADVRDRFSRQGFFIYSVRPKGLLSGAEVRLAPNRNRLNLEQFVIFNQQFYTLIHAGLPIPAALELLLRRQRDRYLRSVLENVRERVRGGEVLSSRSEERR